MPHPFKDGDQVVCTDPTSSISEGEEYEVVKAYTNGRHPMIMVIDDDGDEMGYYAYRFELAERRSTDPLGDAIRRAHNGEDGKPPKKPYTPETFVGRDDIDWLDMIKKGSQS